MILQVLGCLGCYLLGSIPFGLLLTKGAGLGDVRTIGSGNIGATNVLRTGNKKIAALTLVCDLLKAYIPLTCANYFGFDQNVILLFAFFSLLGHIFPVWLKFKGGKGIATALGIFLSIDPLLALVCLSVWIVTLKISRISSLSSLMAVMTAPVYSAITQNIPALVFSLIVGSVIFWAHRENIKRLLEGAESKV